MLGEMNAEPQIRFIDGNRFDDMLAILGMRSH